MIFNIFKYLVILIFLPNFALQINIEKKSIYLQQINFVEIFLAYNLENSGFKESYEIKVNDDDNVIQNTFSFIGQRIFHAKRFCLAFA